MKRLLLISLFALAARASVLAALQLEAQAQVTGAGVFLDAIVVSTNVTVPSLRIADAPRFGQTLTLSREQVAAALSRAPELSVTNLIGAGQVTVSRRARLLDEEEVKLLLTTQLQEDVIKDRGELELRLARPWKTIPVPDEPLQARVIELPATGLSSLFICRFELSATNETVGSWQVSVNAKVWRDVWVSHAPLRRGTVIADANLVRERRDVLSVRDALADIDSSDFSIETAEYVPPNVPLLARSIRTKPVVRRGQSADAMIVDGALAISLKVEVLEDGIPGQTIRIRNPHSRRELRGKVQDEQTILVSL